MSLALISTGKSLWGGGRIHGMSRIQLGYGYKDIISAENLLLAWKEFCRGKRNKIDVQEFSFRLIDNILQITEELASKTYTHGVYKAFNISDPKPRSIHKASVKDRLLHHAIYRILYPFFDKTFIADSYSCRLGKGTYKALDRFALFFRQVSRNNTRTCRVLKCDIKKFFASIDHEILFNILKKYIPDQDILWLLNQIVSSFPKGLPLGNLTSQLLVNIYMNEFDQWVKHKLKTKYYIRYADDFVFLNEDQKYLETLIPEIEKFLKDRLKLTLHPDKVYIKTFASGVDHLGWVHFPYHKIVRNVTKKRIIKKISENNKTSYLGLLTHGDTFKFKQRIDP